MNNNLLIIGAGGHGRVVKETAVLLARFAKIDHLDDQSPGCIGKCSAYPNFTDAYKYAFTAIGDPALRREWNNKLKAAGYELASIIHPGACVSPSARIAAGVFIGAGAVVNTNVVIDAGSIIGIGALVDHDAHVCEYGYVKAGEVVAAG